MKPFPLTIVAFSLLCAGATLQAEPVHRDTMDDAAGFSKPHGVLEVDDAEEGRVILRKTGFEDGFAWLRNPSGKPFPIQDDHYRIEIDVTELIRATLELRIGINDGSGNFIGGFVWEADVREPGTVVLENLGERLEKEGQAGATSFLVMMRVKGDAGATVVIDEFRLSPVPVE